MEFEIYLPCKPDWLCESFMSVFTVLLIVGLILFIRIIYRESKKIKRRNKVRRLRDMGKERRRTRERK